MPAAAASGRTWAIASLVARGTTGSRATRSGWRRARASS